jgi:hypothetical protein
VFFDIELKNQGIVSFDVRKARIRVWRSALPQVSTGLVSFIDLDELEHGENIVDNRNPHLLDMHFTQGERAWRTFSWVFRRQPRGIYLFRIDMDAERDRDVTHISSRSWTQDLCVGKSSR